MRRTLVIVNVVALFALLTSCGVLVRPQVGTGVSDRPPNTLPGGRLTPRTDGDRGLPDDTQPLIDEVCRVQPVRYGWITVRYVEGGKDCPESTDKSNPYTVAVIERYSHKPVGTVMTVCADQMVPRDWVRGSTRDATGACQGASVRENTPTVMVIRRVR